MTERKGSAGQPAGREMINTFPLQNKESDSSFSASGVLKPSVSKKFGDLRRVMAAAYDRLQYGTVRESDIQNLCGRFKGNSIKALRYIHQIHKDTDLSLINGEWCLSQKVRP